MENTISLLKDNNFLFKKKFGQNFVTDNNLLEQIVSDAKLCSTDEVLEIGTGAGTLTTAIANLSKKVLTLEIDYDLKPILNQVFSDYKNIELCFADFMKVSASEVNKHFSGKYKVIANLPYYITSPILIRFMEQDFNVSSLTIMVQKEVAERLVASYNTKDYGSITVQLQSVADVFLTRTVDKKLFTPMPKVDSAVVNIVFNKNKFKIKNKLLHQKVIKSAFSMRRKTLYNCLKSQMNLSGEQILGVLKKLNLDEKIRGEALSVEEFVNLSNAISDLY